MKIIEVKENKKEHLDLLLLADEQEDMIDRYLDTGLMYILDDNGIKCECDKDNDTYISYENIYKFIAELITVLLGYFISFKYFVVSIPQSLLNTF